LLTDEFKSKLLVGVNSLILAGLKDVGGVSASTDAMLGDEAPRPFGVKAGALAACEVRLAFFDGGCIFAGVNDGDSTLSDFLELSDCD
jgi:hypothetical protein